MPCGPKSMTIIGWYCDGTVKCNYCGTAGVPYILGDVLADEDPICLCCGLYLKAVSDVNGRQADLHKANCRCHDDRKVSVDSEDVEAILNSDKDPDDLKR